MSIKKVTILGAGTLGSQIAYQTAYHGFDVSLYDISEESLIKAEKRFKELGQSYKKDLNAKQIEIEETLNRIYPTTDLKDAVADADLTSESVPEDLEIKKDVYRELSEVAPEKTIFTTNSSTMIPSQYSEETGRPEKFLALHFANNIWLRNIAEIMVHEKTDHQVFKTVIQFAEDIGMIPIPIHKEQPGYLLNSLLVPLLNAAGKLLINRIADPESVDRAWMIGTGSPLGPFAILDVVGLTTAYHATRMEAAATQDPELEKLAKYYKEKFINENKLDVSTGEGFYSYPDPEFKNPKFIRKE